LRLSHRNYTRGKPLQAALEASIIARFPAAESTSLTSVVDTGRSSTSLRRLRLTRYRSRSARVQSEAADAPHDARHLEPASRRAGAVFGHAVVATAILNWLLHHSHLVTVRGDGDRLERKRAAGVFSEHVTRQGGKCVNA